MEKNSASVMLASAEMAVTKGNALAVADELRARVIDGRYDLLEVYERLQFNAEVAAQFASDPIRAKLREEIESRGAGTGKVLSDGGVFAIRATGTKYEYGSDRVWNELAAVIAHLNDLRKQREEFLKALPGTVSEAHKPFVLNAAKGTVTRGAAEQITTKPVSSSSTMGFAFTMNK